MLKILTPSSRFKIVDSYRDLLIASKTFLFGCLSGISPDNLLKKKFCLAEILCCVYKNN